MSIRQVIRFLYTKLIELNCFSVRDFGRNVDRMTAKSLGQWSTRLYIVLLATGMVILATYTFVQPETLTKTFDKPSFSLYKDLKQIHGDRLQCSCSLIESKYDRFLQIEPIFHQICSSPFVSNEWQSNLTTGLLVDLSLYHFRDYRRFLLAHLQYLSGLCRTSMESVKNSIDQFLSSLFITSKLLAETSFQTRLDLQIKEYQSDVPVTFNQLLLLVGNINDANAIISTYQTNYVHTPPPDLSDSSFAGTQAVIYEKDCSCGLHQNCTIQANFIDTNSSIIPIKGLKMGCTPSQSFDASTLECFYDSSCLDLIQEYTNSSFSLTPLLNNLSRFSMNTTIVQLTNDLFTETWKTMKNYSSYFEHCAPLICSYTYIQKFNPLYIITLFLGLEGGLSIVLEWICPRIIRLLFKIYQRRKRRLGTVHPLSTIATSINTNIQNPVAASTSISTGVSSQTTEPLSRRCSLKILFICLLLLLLITGVVIFSIYFTRQVNNEVTSTVTFSNTTTHVNSNTTTSTMVTTTVSTCPFTFQSTVVHTNTSYTPTSSILADFNNDGRSDLAILFSYKTGYIVVLLGHGNGTFGSLIRIPNEDYYDSIAAGDMDNDSNIDIIDSNSETSQIGIWFGNGDGTFRERRIVWTGNSRTEYQLIVAEFNNDTYLDIVVYSSNTVWIIFGYGNGSFSAESLVESEGVVSINIGDFNNDGYSDIVMIHFGYYIAVYLGYGNGTFQAQKKAFTGLNSLAYSIALKDFNGDSQLDIAFSYLSKNTIGLMFGYGNGSFSYRKNVILEDSIEHSFIFVDDWNEDGFVDIIVCTTGRYSVIVLLGRANGIFQRQTILSTKLWTIGAFCAIVGDFNGDKHQDLITLNDRFDTFNILLNTCECCASKTLETVDFIHQ